MMEKEINFCQWMISRVCNNKCNYCEVQTTKNQTVDAQYFEAVYRTFKLLDGKIRQLEFIGGEPLDYPMLNNLIVLGNYFSIDRLVIITTGINKGKLDNVVKKINRKKWGFCFTLDIPEEKLKSSEYDMYGAELTGSIRKAKAGWEAFHKYSDSLWLRGHVTIGSHNIADVPKIARQILESGAFFNCCPIIYSRKWHTDTPFMFRSMQIPNIALGPEDRKVAEYTVNRLIELKDKFGKLFLPSVEYLKLIPLCCKNPKELYPACCGDKMPYLRLGDRIAKDGTFEVMVCSDLYLEENRVPKYGLRNWIDNREKVENAWAENTNRRLCQKTQGCVWSASLSLKDS